jgi:tetratricopeptide (TPR) repeat protein
LLFRCSLLAALLFANVLRHGKTPNPEAVRLYELAQWHHQQLTDESLKKAIEHLNQALKIDRNYVPAYTALFRIYNWSASGPEKLEKIKPIASKLRALAPNLAESHHASSSCKYLERDWRGAEEEIQRALQLNPNYAPGHGFYCYYLSLLGRVEEAKVHGKRAQEIEPTSRIEATVAGYPFITAREYDQAIAQFRKALDVDKNFALAHRWIGKALEAKGEYLAALDEFEKNAILSGVDETKARQRFDKIREGYTNSGPRGYWLKVLEFELEAEASHEEPTVAEQDRWSLEGVYAQLGQTNKALDLLEKDFEEGGHGDWLKFEPLYEPLRDEPRFKALLKKAGLEKVSGTKGQTGPRARLRRVGCLLHCSLLRFVPIPILSRLHRINRIVL